jgi:hypothetical protein
MNMPAQPQPSFSGIPDEATRNLHFARANARHWLLAVIEQGQKCKDIQEQLRGSMVPPPTDPAQRREWMDRRRSELDQRQAAMERRIPAEHFFVIAVGKSEIWLNELADLEPGVKGTFDDYLRRLPHARDVRNMREHDEEYFKGKGRAQERFVHESDGGTVDGSATLIAGGKYLLGGRLDLIEAMDAARTVIDRLFPTRESLYQQPPERPA